MQTIRLELGKRVRELRKGHGWSQEKLGEHADLHPTYVGIERGERNVSFDNLCSIAEAFGLTLTEFFDFSKEGQDRRDVLKAQLVGLTRNRSQKDLELFIGIVAAFDRWKGRAK